MGEVGEPIQLIHQPLLLHSDLLLQLPELGNLLTSSTSAATASNVCWRRNWRVAASCAAGADLSYSSFEIHLWCVLDTVRRVRGPLNWTSISIQHCCSETRAREGLEQSHTALLLRNACEHEARQCAKLQTMLRLVLQESMRHLKHEV